MKPVSIMLSRIDAKKSLAKAFFAMMYQSSPFHPIEENDC